MQFLPPAIFIPILAAIGYYDWQKNIIPNWLTYPGAVLAIVLNAFFSSIPLQFVFAGGLLAFIIGFALGHVAGVGGGDLKLMVLIGFMFGLPLFLAVMAGGFMVGGLAMLVTYTAKKEKDEAPFGLYLAMSGVAVSGWLIYVYLLPANI